MSESVIIAFIRSSVDISLTRVSYKNCIFKPHYIKVKKKTYYKFNCIFMHMKDACDMRYKT